MPVQYSTVSRRTHCTGVECAKSIDDFITTLHNKTRGYLPRRGLVVLDVFHSPSMDEHELGPNLIDPVDQ